MNLLEFLNKKGGEILDAREWNLLVSVANILIDAYNDVPDIVKNSVDEGLLEVVESGVITGPKGDKGDLGDVGPQGSQGPLGPQGIRGELGVQGERGPQGEQGPKGDPFTYSDFTQEQLAVLKGPKGDTGETGPAGPQGEQGIQGPAGADGVDGVNGTNGVDGITPHIDSTTGNWFIGNENTGVPALGLQGPTGPQGPKGNQGIQGIQGEQGPAGQNGTNGQDGQDGITPHINPTTKHWMIGETDTGIVAEGLNGTNGTNGTDGITPHIDSTTGNWFIGTTNTGVKAHGFSGDYNDLSNKPTIPDAQIQSDWNLSNNNAKDFIKNKPTIPSEVTEQTVSGWGFTKNTGTSTFSGSYNDLTDKPTLFSGNYDDLTNKPTIPIVPTKVSDFTNDCPYATFNVDTISNNYDYVEIGGVYWATKNVGASSITDVGVYFEYADSNGYTQSLIGIDKNFSKSDSVHYEGNQAYYDNPLYTVINSDRLNSSQNRINSQYDGSSVNMGGAWRIPTKKELKSLFDNSYLTWYSNYNNSGIGGIIFRDKTKSNHSIFIPFSGYISDGLIEDLNSICFWIQDYTDPFYVCGRSFIKEYYLSQDMIEGVEFDINNSRYYSSSSSSNASLYYGITIRPVLDVSKNIANVAITGNYNDLSNKPTIPAALILADWNLTDNTALDYIKNKPTISGGGTQVQADWSESDSTVGSYIQNKPTVTNVAANASNYGHVVVKNYSDDNYFIDSDGFSYSTVPSGSCELSLGSSSRSGKFTLKQGNNSTSLVANSPTAQRTIALPDNSGTVALTSDLSGYAKIWNGTQAQYDALTTKDSNTIYIIS